MLYENQTKMLTSQTKEKHSRYSPVYSAVCWNHYIRWYNNTEHLITTSFFTCCINIKQTSEVRRHYYLCFKERKFWQSKMKWKFSVVKPSSWQGRRWACGSMATSLWFWSPKSGAVEAPEVGFCRTRSAAIQAGQILPHTPLCLENTQSGVISNHIITPFRGRCAVGVFHKVSKQQSEALSRGLERG